MSGQVVEVTLMVAVEADSRDEAIEFLKGLEKKNPRITVDGYTFDTGHVWEVK